MGDKYQKRFWKGRYRQQKSEQWFDATDDDKPFDAFGSIENRQRIGEEIYGKIQLSIRRKAFFSPSYFKVAAAILVFATTGVLISYFISKNRLTARHLLWAQFKTMPGHIDKIALSDGSTVYLRPGAVLKAPQDFNDSLRSVDLIEGEALFEVKHDADHPFIVHSGKLKTQVLGTSFIIKNYNQLKKYEVTVTSGKVSVMNGKRVVGILSRQQMLHFDKTDDKVKARSISNETEENWKNGEYSINEGSIEELAITLEDIYGLKVNLNSPVLRKLKVTIQFNMKDRLTDILDQIQLIHNIKYTIKGREVTLMR